MAKEILTGGDGTTGQSGSDFRASLNRMFTELYNWLHSRQHALDSNTDHSSATGADKGKLLGTNLSTGVPELRFLADTDIPVGISRKAALDAHLADLANPHAVTAEQLGLVPGEVYNSGAGVSIDESNGIYLDPSTLPIVTAIDDSDSVFVSATEGPSMITMANFKLLLVDEVANGLVRYAQEIDAAGIAFEVMATASGITYSLTEGNTLEIRIPAGVVLSSVKLRFTGYSTLVVKLGITDMGNSSSTDRWMPIVQAWNETTHQQLPAITTQPHSTLFDTFTISGLINTATNLIRMNF